MSDEKQTNGTGPKKFVKGTSGNPGGWGRERLRGWRAVAAYASDKTNDGNDMMDVLIGIAMDVTQDGKTRAYAADKVIDRIAGKPRQQVDMTVTGSALDKSDVSKMTDEELVELAASTTDTTQP